MALINRETARKISIYVVFILVVLTIVFPAVGVPLIAIALIVKGWKAYAQRRRDQAYDRHLDNLMQLKEDRPARGYGYRTRIIVPENPQDAQCRVTTDANGRRHCHTHNTWWDRPGGMADAHHRG